MLIENEKYNVSGMSCASCLAHITKAVSKIEGVKDVSVNLLTNSMVVTYEEPANSQKIVKAVSDAGYAASLKEKEKAATVSDDRFADKETPKLIKRLIASLILLVPLFYIGMGYMLSWPLGGFGKNPFYVALTEMLLALVIMLINNKIFINGFKALIKGRPNMDSLVMLGSSISWIYSVAIIFIMGAKAMSMDMDGLMKISMNISFETAGMVPALITIGKTLESFSKGKTTSALKGLLDLAPKEAHLLINGKEVTILASNVNANDTFIVKPGESFPVDGVVIKGESAVDESPLTGESLPIDKKEGDKVSSATINQNGVLICKATNVGGETTLNQIIKMVENAASTKTKISEVADKVAGIFVPMVLSISLIVFAFWMLLGANFVASLGNESLLTYSLERAISILVISCPCALGLATPVAIMVGSGLAAKHNILFKNASSLENTGKIDFVVLDKTGTITVGKPKVTNVKAINKNEKELLEIALSLELNSSHPLAKAIVNYANNRKINAIPTSNFENLPGNGIKADIGGATYLGGSYLYFQKLGIDTSLVEKEASKLSNDGKTPLLFAKNNQLIGIIYVSDTLKDDSLKAINNFKKMGITPIMLTGDNEKTAKIIASSVGIDYLKASCLPIDKQNLIKELKKYGKVAMVGDGINDAVALNEADIGIAIGAGSDIAIDSADVVLMKSSLLDAVKAVNISKKTYKNILENLFWAFIYNLIMIPIASGAFSSLGLTKLRPWMGAAAMSLSSVCVVLNALRLNLYNPSKIAKRRKKEILPKELFENRKEENMEKTIYVEGMMCEHCVRHVKDSLEKIDGVSFANVSLKEKKAVVTLSKDVSDEILKRAIADAGYEAK